MFQSTHPHGVRLIRGIVKMRLQCFNPRTHTGCDNGSATRLRRTNSFNPRTHTGCDIIAPLLSRRLSFVSIHAPTRGATNGDFAKALSLICFNPRTHTGCDSSKTTVRNPFFVSIHAPTRGATCPVRGICPEHKFQSTHPHGVRRRPRQLVCLRYEFQSTHPHGVRRNGGTL